MYVYLTIDMILGSCKGKRVWTMGLNGWDISCTLAFEIYALSTHRIFLNFIHLVIYKWSWDSYSEQKKNTHLCKEIYNYEGKKEMMNKKEGECEWEMAKEFKFFWASKPVSLFFLLARLLLFFFLK